MSAGRFIIEGEWIGYRSSQDRIVHRQVYPGGRKKLRAWAEKTHAIRYTDGTSLLLTVRDCKPRERVKEIRGYTTLIEDCAHYDVNSVDGFYAARGAFRAKAAAARAATQKATAGENE
jgi:hypothetical protein